MLKTTVLICSLVTNPDPSTCTRETAIDIINVSPAKNGVMRGFFGQAAIAPTSVKPDTGKSYMKIVCERTAKSASN